MRQKLVLQSAINDLYYCADRTLPSPVEHVKPEDRERRTGVYVRPNRANVGPWEEHEVEFHEDGTISIRSVIDDNGLVRLWSADPEIPTNPRKKTEQYSLCANRPSDEVGDAEKWKPVFVPEATRFGSEVIKNAWALQNVFNGKFLSTKPLKEDPEGKTAATGDNPNENELLYASVPLIRSTGGIDPGIPAGELTPLGIEGRYFRNASGLFDYREASAFALFERFRAGQLDYCKEFCRVLRSCGVNAVRVILTLGGSYWENIIGITSGPNKPGFYDALNHFTTFMYLHGFYVRVCLIGGLESFGGFSREREDVYSDEVHNRVVEYFHHTVTRLRDEPNVLFEVANEWNQIGMRDSDRRIVELGRLVKALAPHRLMNLTNTNGPIADDPMWAREPADFVDAHLERWIGVGGFSWVKRSSESPVVDNGRMPFISGEAVNLGSPQPGRPDDAVGSPAVAFAYGATSRVKRYLTNFHFHDGLAANIPDELTIACMQGWKRGLDAIPLAFPGSWCNGHHSCAPWDINIFPRDGENEERHTRGPIRIFGLNGSEGYIGVSIAERAGAGVPAHRRAVQEVDRITFGGYSSAVYRA
jgi:hypothetical protein